MAQSFEQLRPEYAELWRGMEIRPDRLDAVTRIANKLIGFKPRYQEAAQATGVPWFVIAALHNRESDANFNTYLGNGEPLDRVTRLVPKGRGPFRSWVSGAIDALRHDGLDQVKEWTPERACYEIEKFNGFGYRNNHPEVKSPYLWSFSNNYRSGKYVGDGHFVSSVVDQQCGAMPVVKRIMELDPSATFQAARLQASTIPIPGVHPPVGEGPLTVGSRGDRVRQLQNTLHQRGYPVGEVDGIYGSITHDAVMAFQRDAGLPQTGVADEGTMRALAAHTGLGSIGERQRPFRPEDIIRIFIGAIVGKPAGAEGRETSPAGPSEGAPANILQHILAPPVTLSPIDKMLGGEALAGKKTMLAIVAYAIMAILQAVGVVGAGTPAGIIINTLIAAFGGLGGLSKIDRVIQALGTIAAARPR